MNLRRADREQLDQALRAARAQTLALTAGLDAGDWAVPLIDIVNPPLWELGHVGWFQERWCLRRAPAGLLPSLRQDADRLYDSSFVEHDSRWSLPLPGPEATRDYLAAVFAESLRALERAAEAELYYFRLALFHEYMHIEAFVYTWQTLARPGPELQPEACDDREPPMRVAAGTVQLGSARDAGFVFDNEKWAHPVALDAFEIDAYPVSNQRFAEFVDAGGYRDPQWWDPAAYRALRDRGRAMPVYWRRGSSGLEQRRFDRWIALDPREPVTHVCAFEAEAYCRWAGRRLPTEAQWQRAADIAALAGGGFHWGRRVWEWTASRFEPFEGFSPDAYADYSAPWFGTRRVLRGGAAATPEGIVDARYRNFFVPERRDIFSGFRTCAPA